MTDFKYVPKDVPGRPLDAREECGHGCGMTRRRALKGCSRSADASFGGCRIKYRDSLLAAKAKQIHRSKAEHAELGVLAKKLGSRAALTPEDYMLLLSCVRERTEAIEEYLEGN